MRPAGGIRATLGNLGRRFAKRAPIFAPVTDNNVVDGDFLRKLDRLSLTLGRDLINGLMGEHLSTRRTSGIEFADYRQYSAGDDLRRVDWNAYARLGTLHVRQAQAEHDTVLFLLVDASPSMDFGTPTKFLSARRLAAGLGYIALSHLDSVVLAAPGADNRLSADPFRGRGQSPGLFRTLQDLNAGQAMDFDGIMRGWSAERMGGGAVGRLAVIVSDLLLDGWRDGVRNLIMNGFSVTVLHVLSPEELAPSEDGDFQLEDSETGERLDVHLGAASLQEYDRRIAAWLGETETWCNANAARYVRLQSDWDIERTLLDLLRKRGVTA